MAFDWKNIVYSAGADILFKGSSIIASILLARSLGSHSFGIYSAILSYATLILAFSESGLHQLSIRKIIKERYGTPETNRFEKLDVIAIKLIIGFSIYCIYLVFSYFHDSINIITASFLVAVPFFMNFEWNLIAHSKIKEISVSKIASSIVFLFLSYVASHYQSTTYAIIAFGSIGITQSICHIYYSWNDFSILNWIKNFQSKRLFATYKQAIITGIGSLFASFVFILPPVIANKNIDIQEISYFGIAWKFIFISSVIDALVTRIFYPKFSASYAATLKISITQPILIVLLLSLLSTTSLVIFSTQIITILFGKVYESATQYLQIVSLFIPITAFNGIFVNVLLATEQERVYLKNSIIGGIFTCISVIIGYFIGKNSGILFTTILSEFLILLLMIKSSARILRASNHNQQLENV